MRFFKPMTNMTVPIMNEVDRPKPMHTIEMLSTISDNKENTEETLFHCFDVVITFKQRPFYVPQWAKSPKKQSVRVYLWLSKATHALFLIMDEPKIGSGELGLLQGFVCGFVSVISIE